MPEETITFELIRKIQREEQKSPKLTKLPENFYQNVSNYLQQKRILIEKMEDRMASIEIKNIERLIEDIFEIRERKILNQSLIAVRSRMPVDTLTDEEKIFFDQIVYGLKQRREEVLKPLMHHEEKVEVSVVFKEDVSAFVGADMKTYGPFNKGDVAKLPEENIKILREKNIVEEFKESK